MLNVIPLTQDLIRCRSITPEDDGAQQVLMTPLKQMGFEIFNLPFDGNGSYPVKNFFARLGTGAPHLMYAGHTDVVPVGDETAWTHPPFDAVIENGVMIGRGTSDMKGGNAAFITAISKFLDNHKNFKGSISVLITGDEERDRINGTNRVMPWLAVNNHIPDMCLVGESSNPTELGQAIKIGRRGSLHGHLTIFGKQGHVAYPENAINPAPFLCKAGTVLSSTILDNGTEHFDPSNLEIISIEIINPASNMIAEKASLKFNVRFNTLWTMKTLDEKLRKILGDLNCKFELKTSCNTNPFINQSEEWTKTVSDIVEKHCGQTPELSTSGGTSDAPFIAPYCPVVEFGLTNETIHQIDESLKISDLEKLVEIYTDIIEKTLS